MNEPVDVITSSVLQWPFVRFLGIQEPAATLFSILNLVGHVVMIKKFRREVRSSAPFYLMTHVFCLVSLL